MKNRFSKSFASYVCEGDSITADIDGLTYTASIVRDDDSESPDKRDEGFYPSLDPKSAGYIGPKSKATLARQLAKAESVLKAWRNDEWFYCGIVLRVTKWVYVEGRVGEEVEISSHAASLWGIECNYPAHSRNKNPNSYLTTVANELLDEAIEHAARVVAELQTGKGKA